MGIQEYFQYDPSGDYLTPIVQGLRLVNGNYQAINPVEVKSFDNMRLHSDVLDLYLCLISGELRFQNPQTGDFLLTHEEEREGRIEEKQGRIQEKYARLQAESDLKESEEKRLESDRYLKNLATQLLNSGFTVEQLAQMMQLSVEKVKLLVEE